ncbi:hypothetical protein [Glycomyces paridis]|uniref:Uncharacterized protein n=1 Tax=Glycomyces paridis TaxID=2126555 RepID=A0A4S8PKZ2_9ACTN|nr:hypothetical protein [Glycomyces paridis]THV31428.1 hypothetical protein E9998_03435 [Glycomyces paridis]
MSGASPPADHGPEIDLGAVEVRDLPDPPEEAPAKPRRFDRLTRHANAVMAIGAAVLVVAAAVLAAVKWSPLHRPIAEATVQAFLEAVHDRDVDLALSYTDELETTGEFLVPEALDSRWTIETVAQVDFRESENAPGRSVAKVYAEIEAFDGTRIGHRYSVGVEDGKARIENGLTTAENYSVFDHLTVNGVTVDAAPGGAIADFKLLPGVYELYPDLPSTLEFVEPNTSVALGNHFSVLGTDWDYTGLPISYPELSDEGLARATGLMEDHFDRCAAEAPTPDCPFDFPEDPEREVALAPGAGWRIESYPQVAVQWIWYEEREGAELITTVPGSALAEVVITEDGREREATVSCPIWTDGMFATVDFEGGVGLAWGPAPLEDHCRALVEVD